MHKRSWQAGERFYQRAKSHALARIGSGLILFFLLIALLAPFLAPPVNEHQPYLIPRDGFSPIPQAPGAPWLNRPPPLPFWGRALLPNGQWTHLLGTAEGQWDIYYGIVWGTRTALTVGLVIEVSTLVIGLLIGSVAAFYGQWLDELLMRFTDIMLAFPPLFAALTLSTLLTPLIGKGIWPATLALIAFGWMGYARLIRGDLLALRQRDFVTAARVVGAGDWRILCAHLLPNAITPTLILASANLGADVLAFAALSFLGIGVEVGYADWGQLISVGRNWIPSLATYWWVVVWPSLALTLFVLGWNLVGDALRDGLDP